jgi:hypothetical protein
MEIQTQTEEIIKEEKLEDILEEYKEHPSFVLELITWLYENNKYKLFELLNKLNKSKEINNLININDIDYDKLKTLN